MDKFKVGKWVPSDQKVLEDWKRKLIIEVDTKPVELHPVISEFRDFIESDATVYMLFNQMFTQVPHTKRFEDSPTGKPQVRDYKHMLALLNAIMTKAPEFNETGLVGFPINAILDWSMATTGGFAGFLNEKVNLHLKRILNQWAVFLSSTESCEVLSENPRNGWFGEDAQKAMPTFVEDFQCDPQLDHYGFTSWDNFFTRVFKPGKRPIASPENSDIIANACESAPYKIAKNVQALQPFWIKAQTYSLSHILNTDPMYHQFVGGTIYQAFLSAFSYHRWHSPVDGTVVKTELIDGTYYSETLVEGYDPSGPNESQGYIAELAARAVIYIQADNPKIGLMCFVAIGMAEVSTCDVTVFEGQHIKKGQQTGMFHFGGSTHLLIFRPEVELEFNMHGQTPGLDSSNIPVNAEIARVK
ncbi:MAG: phosphatidylserine decarboxylase family protein [Flavobacteriaceae bacterium]